MELKLTYEEATAKVGEGFNRTFMELKSATVLNRTVPAVGFNRTFMELK